MRLRTDALQQCWSRGLISDHNMSKAERRETTFMPIVHGTWGPSNGDFVQISNLLRLNGSD